MARPRQHNREAVLAAAALVLVDQGVAATTAQIAKAAGVSNGTLFNYFPTKQTLMDALYRWLRQDLSDSLGDIDPSLSARAQVHLLWERWIGWARQEPERHDAVQLLRHSGLVSDNAQADSLQLFSVPVRVLQSARADGELVDLPIGFLAELMEKQFDHAAAAKLDDAATELAFSVMWASISK